MNPLAITALVLSIVGLLMTYIGYKLRTFDEEIEEIFRDSFNVKLNEHNGKDKGTDN